MGAHVFDRSLNFYIPITRLDEEERIAEGYAFVNETVEGEGGLCLKRSAMEEATPDYLKWGAVREMHSSVAAGTATAPGCGVEWTDKGAYFRAKIVDDGAWKKCKEGVYKGFSVGVRPRLMRAKNVELCRWIETSLVDRPKDGDAVINLFRADGSEAEYEVEVEEEEQAAEALARAGIDSKNAPTRENLEPKGDTHYACGADGICHGHTTRGGAQECGEKRQADTERYIAEMQAHVDGLRAKRGEDVSPLARFAAAFAALTEETEVQKAAEVVAERVGRGDTPDLTRLSEERDTLLTRAETAEAEVATVRADLTAAAERIQRLEREPAPSRPPVRFPAATGLQRSFAADAVADPEAEALRAEYVALVEALAAEKDEGAKRNGVIRMQVIKSQLASRGEPLTL